MGIEKLKKRKRKAENGEAKWKASRYFYSLISHMFSKIEQFYCRRNSDAEGPIIPTLYGIEVDLCSGSVHVSTLGKC